MAAEASGSGRSSSIEPAPPNPRLVPVTATDETRYRRRYKALKEMVYNLSDETNLLALKVHQIQQRIYLFHMREYGRPPAPVQVPEGATWFPLAHNSLDYPWGSITPHYDPSEAISSAKQSAPIPQRLPQAVASPLDIEATPPLQDREDEKMLED